LTMPLFRKKPVVIEAIQFTEESKDRAFNFITCNKYADFEDGVPVIQIQTLEGVHLARFGDWIIKGVAGEYYPCKDEIFQQTYEPVTEDKYLDAIGRESLLDVDDLYPQEVFTEDGD